MLQAQVDFFHLFLYFLRVRLICTVLTGSLQNVKPIQQVSPTSPLLDLMCCLSVHYAMVVALRTRRVAYGLDILCRSPACPVQVCPFFARTHPNGLL